MYKYAQNRSGRDADDTVYRIHADARLQPGTYRVVNMTTIEDIIDKTAAGLMFLTFPLMMTAGAASNSSDMSTIVEGTNMTIGQLATLMGGLGILSFFLGFAVVGLILILPRSFINKEIRRPRISIEW